MSEIKSLEFNKPNSFVFIKKFHDKTYSVLGIKYRTKPPMWLALSLEIHMYLFLILVILTQFLTRKVTVLEGHFPVQNNIVLGSLALLMIYCIWRARTNYSKL
jgi:hypothetical protein